MAKGVIKNRKVKKNNRKMINIIKKKKSNRLCNKIRGIMNYLKSDFYLYSYCVSSSPSTDYCTQQNIHKSAVADSELRRARKSVFAEDVDLQTDKGRQNSVDDEVGDLGKGGEMHDAIIGGEKQEHIGKGGGIMQDLVSDKQGDIGKGSGMQVSIAEKEGDVGKADSRIQDSIGYKQGDGGAAASPRDVVIRSPPSIRSPSSLMTIRPGKKQAGPQSIHVSAVRPKTARGQVKELILSSS